MRLIQEIGSYAGLAAIPGLAILSALYFSQARDVRRLRDWAGRAPERASEQAQGGRVLPRPATQAGAAQPAQPVAQPVAQPAAAAATGAASAASGGGGGGTATATRPAAAPPGTHPPVPRVPVSGQTSVLPAPSPNGGDPWYRRAANRLPAGRYIAVFLVGIAVLGGGIAFGITQLNKTNTSSQNSAGNTGGANKPAATKKKQPKPAPPPINPGTVKVTVENGTGVTGLAHNYGTKLQQDGFNVINQLTSTQSGVAESVVEFRPGKSREAALVRRKLGIAQIQPADSTRLSQSGGSDVIVLLGADLANKPAP